MYKIELANITAAIGITDAIVLARTSSMLCV